MSRHLLPLLIGVVVATISPFLVALVRRYALRTSLLDHPSARASHAVPTPRGGGVVPAALLVIAIVALVPARQSPLGPFLAAALGLLLVAAIGWIDDRQSLGVAPRLLAHLAGSLLILPLVSTLPSALWLAGPLGLVCWTLWGISAINLVNFMDGIDGLVGSQMLLYGAHLVLLSPDGTAGLYGATLVGGSFGFLWWNWPPARIFLGDVGSGALGLAAVLGGVLVLREGNAGLLVVYLPLYGLLLDATLTLVRRALRGEPLHQAHRSHFYQRLANEQGWGHARVSLLFAAAAVTAMVLAHVTPDLGMKGVAGYCLAVPLLGWAIARFGRLAPARPGEPESSTADRG